MVTAPVNRIIPFSSVDGPGSRTAVFLQGCNLDCRYCHNPETRNLCVGCGACVGVCKTGALSRNGAAVSYDWKKCVFCDACIQTCRHGSSPRIRRMTAGEAFAEIERQMPFIRGVTVSGGECTLYPEFLEELFAICRSSGLHTLLDSNGTVDFETLPGLMAVTDGVMLDIKAFDSAQHRETAGADNEQILKNAVWLMEQGKLYEVRTVVVPGLFDAEDTVRRTARLIVQSEGYKNQNGARLQPRYKLISYRENGVRKEYRRYPLPDREQMERLAAIAKEEGMKEIVIV